MAHYGTVGKKISILHHGKTFDPMVNKDAMLGSFYARMMMDGIELDANPCIFWTIDRECRTIGQTKATNAKLWNM